MRGLGRMRRHHAAESASQLNRRADTLEMYRNRLRVAQLAIARLDDDIVGVVAPMIFRGFVVLMRLETQRAGVRVDREQAGVRTSGDRISQMLTRVGI